MKHALLKPLTPVSLLLLCMQSQFAWSLGGPISIQHSGIKTTAAAATLPLPASAVTPPALPNSGCSLNTLAGNYVYDETSRESFADQGYPQDGGWVFNVSVGREHNDGHGNITGGLLITNSSFGNPDNNVTLNYPYVGKVTVNPDCTGTYDITVTNPDGSTSDGGGGPIFIDPLSGNFTLLDAHELGSAKFVKDSFTD